MNHANNINGIAHHVRIAPPVNITSVIFIAASIPTILIKLIPIATLKASLKVICFDSMKVSSAILVSNPFIIASVITPHTGKVCSIF